MELGRVDLRWCVQAPEIAGVLDARCNRRYHRKSEREISEDN